MPAPVTICMPAAPWPGCVVGEGIDQSGADAVAAESRGQVDVQMGRELPAQLGEVGAEVGDVREAVLQRGDSRWRPTGNRRRWCPPSMARNRASLPPPQVRPKPALAKCLALGSGREAARAGLEEDGVDLG